MTSCRQERIEALCQAALERDTAQRAAFLHAACGGDETLHQEVASLLLHHTSAEEFLGVSVPCVLANSADDHSPLEMVSEPGLAHALAPDERFGPYQVLGIIGAGGMGEVYRARDSGLNRDVALKVLPERFARDVDRLARLQREAQVLASLSHPNIATIYGIERVGDTFALVMEVVEGATISARLRRGPLRLREALTIAHQIADALEAAHERAIVHRDLKPANVMVTPNGHVKLLDFGVAKVFDIPPVGVPAEAPAAPAATDTQPGTVPGTAAYMSPEQVRGDVIDRRSDIWAFGCVLFEMLSGKSPFVGKTVEETVAKVADGAVDFADLPAATPASTRRLLRLCLERSIRVRLQHIGDARVDIGDTLVHLSDERSSGSPAPVPLNGRRPLVLVAAALILLVVLAGGLGWYAGSQFTPRGPAQVVRFTVNPSGIAVLTPTARTIAISPDGSQLAYISEGWLWLRPLHSLTAVRVPGTDNSGGEPFFSPDGEWVGFFDVNTGLKKVPVRGGRVLPIIANAGRQLGASWGADGTIIFADGVGLFAVGADGEPQMLARPSAAQGETRYAWPQILPGGRRVMFTVLHDDSIDNAEIVVLDLDSKQHRLLLRGGHAARYTATGHMIYAAKGQLHMARLDLASLSITGETSALASVQMTGTAGSATANFDVSRTGTLVYVAAEQQRLRTIVWVDRDGKEEAVAAAPGYYLYPRLSPDSTRIALDVKGANRDIWVFDIQRGVIDRITDGPTEDMMPAWSSDGKSIYFASDGDGVFSIFVVAADGSAPATRIFQGPDNYMPFFSPDPGRLLMFTHGPTAGAGDISLLRLTPPTRLEPVVHTKYRDGNPHVSPDSRWVAYQSEESGQPEIYIRSFPALDRKVIVSRRGGTQPRWSADGDELFYLSLEGTMRSVAVRLTPDLTIGDTTDLFPARGYAGASSASAWAYDVSPKTGRFLMLKEQASTDAFPINVVVNWFEELARTAPSP